MRSVHGTPSEFAEAVNNAADDLFCTTSEAEEAIRKYRAEWAEAPETIS